MVKFKMEFNINIFGVKSLDINPIVKRPAKLNSLHNVDGVKSAKNPQLLPGLFALDKIIPTHTRKPRQPKGNPREVSGDLELGVEKSC
jgi:hypothetical protein